MVYEKYVKRGGKLCGPYYYESYRDPDGKVKKRYLGSVNPAKKSVVLQVFLISLAIVLVFFVLNQAGFKWSLIGKTIDEPASENLSEINNSGEDNLTNIGELVYLRNNESSDNEPTEGGAIGEIINKSNGLIANDGVVNDNDDLGRTFGILELTRETQHTAGILCDLYGQASYAAGCYQQTSFMNNTCIDTSGNNDIGTDDYCHAVGECNAHLGASCNYYANPSTYQGICVTDMGSATCTTMSVVSGEYGSGFSNGGSANFHTGNENGSCTSQNELSLCSSSSSYNPTSDGICYSMMCSTAPMGSSYVNCGQDGNITCAVNDVRSVSPVSSCMISYYGWACDSAVASSGWVQDGICANDGSFDSCITSASFVCNKSGSFYNSTGNGKCVAGNTCDAVLADGNFNATYGNISWGRCIQGGAPSFTNCTAGTGSQCSMDSDMASDTCIDANGDNNLNISDLCYSVSSCANNIGKSCDKSPGTQGICVADMGSGSCAAMGIVSGEYGSGFSNGGSANFHTGNENASCSMNTELSLCSSTGGVNPSSDAICYSSMCNSMPMGSSYVNCGQDGNITCAINDVRSVPPVTSCMVSYYGWACDSSLTSTGWVQDGICAKNAVSMMDACITSGFVCNHTGFFYNSSDGGIMSCGENDTCDSNFTDGNFNSTYGLLNSTGNCVVLASEGGAPDITNPLATINLPTNTTYNSSLFEFNVSLNENGSVLYSLTNGIVNYTMSSQDNRNFNHTNASILDGTYTFRVYANDTAGNQNHTESIVFSIDTTYPLINYNSNSVANNSNLSVSAIFVNVSASDTNRMDTITIKLYNSTYDQVNISSNRSSPLAVNFTGQADGIYYINASVNDSVGHVNWTNTRRIMIDRIAPSINFTSPTLVNGSSNIQTNIPINVTAEDGLTNIDTIIVYLYNSSWSVWNTSQSSPLYVNYTNLGYGSYFINASVNDSVGNRNYIEVRNISLAAPASVVSCGVLNSSLTLTNDVNSTGTCFTIGADNVTLDCAGYSINYSINESGYGVNITGYNNATIKNCKINQMNSSLGFTYLSAVLLNDSQNSTMLYNKISLVSQFDYGIVLDMGSNYPNISSNNLTNYAGVRIQKSQFSNMENNSFGYGVYLILSNNTQIRGNTITYSDISGVVINLDYSSNTSIINNNISSPSRCGIEIDEFSPYSQIVSNIINAGGDSLNRGVDIRSPNVNFVSNTIISREIGLLITGNYNNVSFNNITTIWKDKDGISLGGQYNLIENNIINLENGSSGGAIVVADSNNHQVIKNNIIKSLGDAFIFNSISSYTDLNLTIQNNTLLAVGNYDFNLTSEIRNKTILKNQVIRKYVFNNSGVIISLENTTYGRIDFIRGINGSGVNLVGNSTSDIQFGNNSILVNISSNIGLNSSANVTLYGIGNRGFILPKILRDGSICADCYNFTALDANMVVFNVTGWSNYTLAETVDAVSPLATINLPTNTTYNSSSFNFNVSLNENGSVLYSLTNGVVNYTMSSQDNRNFNHTNASILDGTYIFRVYANDTAGNQNYTESIVFSIDTTYPLINYNSNSIANNSNLSVSAIFVNISASDTNDLDTIIINLYNSTYDEVNSLTNISSPLAVNFTGHSDGIYYINASVNDSAGHVNYTSTRRIMIDAINPLIEYTSGAESDNSAISRTNIFVNVSVTELNEDTIIFRLFNLTSLVNESSFRNLNRIVNWTSLANTNYTFNVSVNDSVGRINTTTIRNVMIDTTYPLIGNGSGMLNSGTNTSRNNIFVNVTFTEIHQDTIIFELYNSTSLVNRSSYTDEVREVNFTGLADERYWYNVTINDSAGNRNYTSTYRITLDRTPPSINFTAPTLVNGSSNWQTSIPINITAVDNLTNIDTIVMYLYNSSWSVWNTSQSSPLYVNYTNLGYGSYFINASVNDSVGNRNYTEVRNITLISGYGTANCTSQSVMGGAECSGQITIDGNIDYDNAYVNYSNVVLKANNLRVGAGSRVVYRNATLVVKDLIIDKGAVVEFVEGTNTIWHNGDFNISGTAISNNEVHRMNNSASGIFDINVLDGGNWTIVNASNITYGESSSAYYNFDVWGNLTLSDSFVSGLTQNGINILSGARNIYVGGAIFTESDTSGGTPSAISTAANLSLTGEVKATHTAIRISGNNVDVDCRGNIINYSSKDIGNAINGFGGYDYITVKNCNVVQDNSSVIGAYGISFMNAHNVSVLNNTVNIKGTSYGILFYLGDDSIAANNTVTMNNINSNGIFAYGSTTSEPSGTIAVLENNVTIKETIVSVGNSYAIYFLSVFNASVNNNSVRTEQYSSHGIYSSNGNKTTIKKNNILTKGNLSYAIWLYNNDFGYIENNYLVTLLNQSHGIYLTNNLSSGLVNNNTILIYGSASTYGLYYLDQIHRVNTSFNTVTTYTRHSNCILLSESHNNMIYNNKFNTTNLDSNVVLLSYSSNNTLVYNELFSNNTNSHSFIFGSSFDNIFENNTILKSGQSAFRAYKRSINYFERNNITNNILIDIADYDIDYFNKSINDTWLIDQVIDDYNILESTLNLKKSGFGEIKFTEGVNGTGVNLVGNATSVIVFGNNSVFVNASANSGGFNKSANITLYGIGNRGFSYPTILREGGVCNSSTIPSCYNFTSLTADVVMFNVTSWSNYSIGEGPAPSDTTNPLVTINNLANTTYNSSSFNFNVSLNENGSVLYSLTNGIVNYTMSSQDNRNFNHTNASILDGTYTFRVYANDTSNNRNETESIVFSIDTTYPLIDYNSNSVVNNSNLSVSAVFVNVSASDNGAIDTIAIRLYNSTYDLVNSSTNMSSPLAVNFTGHSDGIYYINASVNDSAGHVNWTNTRRIMIDAINPLIEYTSGAESDNSAISRTNIFVNVSVTELNEDTIIFRLFNLTSLVNESSFRNLNRVINWTSLANTNYTFNVSVNDSVGRINTTAIRNVMIDTTYPLIGNGSGMLNSGTNTSRNNIFVNVTFTEIHQDTIIFELYNSTSLVNRSSYRTGVREVNFTNLADERYWYNVTINDSAGNMNYTLTYIATIDTTAPYEILAVSPSIPNIANLSYSAIPINISANDSLMGVDTIIINLINSTRDVVNFSSGVGSQIYVNFTGHVDGIYYVNASVNDSVGNINVSTIKIVRIDRIAPSINFTSPTLMNDSSNTQTNIPINVSAEDSLTGIDTIIVYIYNNAFSAWNTSKTSPLYVNYASLSAGTYYINASVNDSAGNMNYTEVRTITLRAASTGGDSPGGGGGSGNNVVTPPTPTPGENQGEEKVECTPVYDCSPLGRCMNSTRLVKCVDRLCGQSEKIKEISCSEEVCIPDFECTGWGACINEKSNRICIDKNSCANATNKPIEEMDCLTNTTQGGLLNRLFGLFGSETGSCQPDVACGEGTCEYEGKVKDIIEGKVQLYGMRENTCEDKNNCVGSYNEEMPCTSDMGIETERREVCQNSALISVSNKSGKEVSQIDLSSWKSGKFNVLFMQGSVVYCAECYNGVKDNNEEGIDCGGSCKACKESGFILTGKLLLWIILILWIIFVLLVGAYVWRIRMRFVGIGN